MKTIYYLFVLFVPSLAIAAEQIQDHGPRIVQGEGTSPSLKASKNRCEKREGEWWFIDDAYSLHPRTKRESWVFIHDKIGKLTSERFLETTVDFVLTYYDLCGIGTGKWQDIIGTELCVRLAAYDIAHEYALFEHPDQAKQPSIFSPAEIVFLRTIYKSCRPTSYRWTDFEETITHVSFEPTEEESKSIQSALGINQ